MKAGGRSATSTATSADAVPPRPSETCTRIVTRPVRAGAVQRAVAPSAAPAKLPSGALHAYVSGSPSGSDAVALSLTAPPGATSHGSHDADTVGVPFVGGRGRTVTVTGKSPSGAPSLS